MSQKPSPPDIKAPEKGPKILIKWDRITITPSCWVWTGPVDGFGYGMTYQPSAKVRAMRAHRAVWQFYNGDIPKGLLLRHRCDNPPCVNPDHLELGTHADNAHDRDSRGRHTTPKGVEHGMARLTPEQVREIRQAKGYGVCRGLAEKFGVSIGHVYTLRSTKPLWKDVVA